MRRLFAVAAVALVAACSTLDHGTVTEKKWFDEYVTLMPVWTSCGNNCSTLTTVEIYTPACWQLFLRDGEETGAPCVEPNEWMRYQVGGQYP